MPAGPSGFIAHLLEERLKLIPLHRFDQPGVIRPDLQVVNCHRQGQIAPFALGDYGSVKGWGEMIAEVVREERMPPNGAACEAISANGDAQSTNGVPDWQGERDAPNAAASGTAARIKDTGASGRRSKTAHPACSATQTPPGAAALSKAVRLALIPCSQ